MSKETPNNREGFWRGTDGRYPELPKPQANFEPWEGKEEFLENLDLAEARAEKQRFKGLSTCRLCSRANGSVTYALEGWEWPSGFRHYVSIHNVRPSLAFQEFILGGRLT